MNYSDKLKSPLWQKKRLEVLKAGKWKCKLCKDEKTTLHVHHNSYDNGKEPWEYPNSNFTVLCEHCHFEVENLKKDNENFDIDDIEIYKSNNWEDNSRIMFIKKSICKETIMRLYDKSSNYVDGYNFAIDIELKNISKIFKH
jgi:hypothetical protein